MSTENLDLKASWDIVKEKLKENDHTLTDDELQYSPGEEDLLLEKLAARLGRTKQETKMYIESLSGNAGKAG